MFDDMSQSAEFKAFVKLLSDLHTGIREGLDPLLQDAYAKSLISLGVYQGASDVGLSIDARTNKFLKGVKDRVSLDPSAFDDFTDILFAQTGMEFLADRLRKCKTLPSSPEQETSRAKDDLQLSFVRSGPAHTTYPPPSDLLREGEASMRTPLPFSVGLHEQSRLNVSIQPLKSPPPKAAMEVHVKDTPKVKVDMSLASSLLLSDSPTTGKKQIPPAFKRSVSQERMSELTPVKADHPKLMKTVPTPTTNHPGPVTSSKNNDQSSTSLDSPPKACNISSDQPSSKAAEPEPAEISVKPCHENQSSQKESNQLLEPSSDDLRPRSVSVESSLDFFTPMSTPPVQSSQQSPPSFICPNTSFNPVQESQSESKAAIAMSAAPPSGSTQTDLETPSPMMCTHYMKSMELAVQVKALENDMQACFQRENDALAQYNSDVQQLNQQMYTLQQHNEQLQRYVEMLTAQVDERNRKIEEQKYESYRLKRELETHEAKAKGFDFVLKSEKLQQQLDVANDRLSAMEQQKLQNAITSTGTSYIPIEYPI